MSLLSWGNYPHYPQTPHPVYWPAEAVRHLDEITREGDSTTLAFGCGRSYGDSCLAESNHVMTMAGLDKFISADWDTGVVVAQAGMTLAELINISLPHGWFVPVTPGTKYVTLGGAVANDVHGKNHHVKGTFGQHVNRLQVYRSDEGILECSPSTRNELFAATVGGLGLTGIILTVELQLIRVRSSKIDETCIRFETLDEFFELSERQDLSSEYSVAWIDCLAEGKNLGRGHYITGNHSLEGGLSTTTTRQLSMPVLPPFSLINKTSLKAFNFIYYHRQSKRNVKRVVEYNKFFYPLDGLLHWNRIYGRPGFQQYQCVVPNYHGKEVIREVIREISKSGSGSFLAVLKRCGDHISPGLLSFPIPGFSLALDFPQHAEKNSRLFSKLDNLVHEAGGRLYPAKDAHMTADHFKRAYPAWSKVEQLRDPLLLSRFWKRVAL